MDKQNKTHVVEKRDDRIPSSSVRKNRLNQLIAYLKYIDDKEPERFSLNSWMEGSSDRATKKALKTWPKRYKKGRPLNCGTVACVVGHLPVTFPDHWRWEEEPTCAAGDARGISVRYDYSLDELIEMKGFEVYLPSVAEPFYLSHFFGGTAANWHNIIYNSAYESIDPPLDYVIQRIEKLRYKLYSDAT